MNDYTPGKILKELLALQAENGYLSDMALRALSLRLQTPLHRLHEVASFYPHFQLQPPPPATVRVCRDMACHILGSEKLGADLEATAKQCGGDVRVEGVSCLGQCDSAPSAVSINDHVYWGKPANELRDLVRRAAARQALARQHGGREPLGWKIDVYEGKARYDLVKEFVEGRLSGDDVLGRLKDANLAGMGGAGFPTHLKWTAVRNAPGTPKFVICNADESEPGTFKDRELLRRAPYLTIEGMVLAGLITGAQRGWIYIRHEYHDEMEALRLAIEQAYRYRVLGDKILGSSYRFDLEVFVSPGGYIQGEESALLEAMEDRRGEPRNKPPFPVTHGLFNKPTVINNVETLAWVPAILKNGGEWYRTGGVNGASGLRFVSISGDVVKPGVYEVPFGQTVRDLVVATAGGLRDGQNLKAIATSGPSGGFLPAFIPREKLPKDFADKRLPAGSPGLDILDLTLDGPTLRSLGGMLGAAFVVYGHRRNMVEQALNCVQFYRNESCGKCVPCRMGSQKLADIIASILQRKESRDILPVIGDLSLTMTLASICGLGMVAANPMATVAKYFPEELEPYLHEEVAPSAIVEPSA